MMLATPLLFALASQAGTCVAVQGERIYGHDVASALPAFAAFPSEFPLAYAPVPGVRRVLSGDFLKRIAKNQGLEIDSVSSMCFERPLLAVGADSIREAIEASLHEARVDRESIQIEVVRWGPPAVPQGQIVFPLAGIQAPSGSDPKSEVMLRGYVLYGDHHRFGMWAAARISATSPRVVAVSALTPGQPVREDQVRLESRETFALDPRPARRLDEVLGYLPRNLIPSGSLVWRSQLSRVPEVTKGDLVKVQVTAGPAHLFLEGRAQTSGTTGASVWVRNPSSGKQFRGTITGKGTVRVGETSVKEGLVQ